MANSIRTPKEGKSATSRRIAEAVDDEDWQRFRLRLKGSTTEYKVDQLRKYYDNNVHSATGTDCPAPHDGSDCNVCIRVDNYIKALCRGGQLHAGMSLHKMLECDWMPHIKS